MKLSRVQRRTALRLRARILDSLGGVCACCGEQARRVLTVDHVQGGGTRHRRELSDPRDYYRSILAEGCTPDRYRLLCLNCHESVNERGECHHQQEARRLAGLAA